MLRPLLLAAGLLAATSASAADKPKARPTPGARTVAAVSPRVAAEFKASDTNRDGFLTRQEVQARIGRMGVGQGKMSPAQAQLLASSWFGTADRNNDGKVSPAEMQGLLTVIARRYDTNGDGVVSVAEREAARKETLSEVGGARGKAGSR